MFSIMKDGQKIFASGLYERPCCSAFVKSMPCGFIRIDSPSYIMADNSPQGAIIMYCLLQASYAPSFGFTYASGPEAVHSNRGIDSIHRCIDIYKYT